MTITEVLAIPVLGLRIRRQNWHKRVYIILCFDEDCNVWYFKTPMGNRIKLSAHSILAINWEVVL